MGGPAAPPAPSVGPARGARPDGLARPGPRSRGRPPPAMTGLDHLDVDRSPFHRLIGLELVQAEAGTVELRLPWRDALGRADGSDWYHGGVLSALIDIAGDYAIATKVGRGVPTIDLRVDYLRPARRGELRALARALKVGRTVGVADVELRDATGALVAIGRCAYSTAG
jgi:uncharacterized protein (TIGR00369 family)